MLCPAVYLKLHLEKLTGLFFEWFFVPLSFQEVAYNLFETPTKFFGRKRLLFAFHSHGFLKMRGSSEGEIVYSMHFC